ncbi:5,10-methylenetetrahydrofolate reductase-like isoform X2 [Coccinella septempunctata]|uniref:5,10-methylenetetrahydrofolate reductase-like isoform X2 n=1 Tax=Coccinella septempunctata TaxID=41139 RepID=UPI001D0738B6|nr:5,10-methylenetetrahydrofolate reductase-like isoform X2 [Coccinella septempunctata]
MDSTLTTDQKSLTAIFNSKKSMSLEVNSNETIDLDTLPTMLMDFVAISWIGNFEGFSAKNIPAIKLAEELISRKITVLLHIACRNLNKVSAMNILMYIRHIGIRNILALEGESKYVTEKDLSEMDFPYTSHFVEFIKENFENFFTIGVTGYPQKHPRSRDMNQELEFLRLKSAVLREVVARLYFG